MEETLQLFMYPHVYVYVYWCSALLKHNTNVFFADTRGYVYVIYLTQLTLGGLSCRIPHETTLVTIFRISPEKKEAVYNLIEQCRVEVIQALIHKETR